MPLEGRRLFTAKFPKAHWLRQQLPEFLSVRKIPFRVLSPTGGEACSVLIGSHEKRLKRFCTSNVRFHVKQTYKMENAMKTKDETTEKQDKELVEKELAEKDLEGVAGGFGIFRSTYINPSTSSSQGGNSGGGGAGSAP